MRRIAAGAVFILFMIFSFASSPLALAGDSQSDYVRYVVEVEAPPMIPPTVIEGTIVDNELGTPVGGAGVGGEVHSEIIYVNVQADANGHFRVTLPGGENHTYVLNISAPGYDNRTITGSVKSGESKNLGQIPINYNPFDVKLAENSGLLTRGWVENRYSYAMTDNYKATRQVVTGYKGERGYNFFGSQVFLGTLYTDKVPASIGYYNVEFWRKYVRDEAAYRWDTYATIAPNSFQEFDYVGSSWYLVPSGNTYDGKPLYSWVNYNPGNSLESKPGFCGFQGFGSAGWWAYMPVYDRWHPILPEYYVYAPTQTRAIGDVGYSVSPIYGSEEYTVWRTTTYRINDHALDNWGIQQTTVTATPRNGYTGGVKLELVLDNALEASLGENELQFASPASTTLTLTPKPSTHGSLHSATLKAYDSNGRLVFGGAKPALTYNLSLTTLSKPPVENTVVGVTESETKPDEQGSGGSKGTLFAIGANGCVRDASTGQPVNAYPTVTATITSNKQSSFGMSASTAYYSLSSYTSHPDEVWVMSITASADKYQKQTQSATSSANNTVTVNFSLTKIQG